MAPLPTHPRLHHCEHRRRAHGALGRRAQVKLPPRAHAGTRRAHGKRLPCSMRSTLPHACAVPEDCGDVQGERYSQVGFVWPTDSTLLQGPLKKFPPITFKQFMDVKSQVGSRTCHMNPEEHTYSIAQEWPRRRRLTGILFHSNAGLRVHLEQRGGGVRQRSGVECRPGHAHCHCGGLSLRGSKSDAHCTLR